MERVIVNSVNGESAIEQYKTMKSISRTQYNRMKHRIKEAREAQIIAERKRMEVVNDVQTMVDDRLMADIERFIRTGNGNFGKITAELKVYYDVEYQTKCYLEH